MIILQPQPQHKEKPTKTGKIPEMGGDMACGPVYSTEVSSRAVRLSRCRLPPSYVIGSVLD